MSFTLKSQSGIQAADALPAITVHDVHLSYRSIVPVSKRKTQARKKGRVEHFEALHGVSFTIGQGEIVGLVGRNGSGKSTLLRVLAGIFEPDKGFVDLHGHTVSLLALGVGFQTQLSGRENIYLSGLLLGFTKQDIDAQIDEIIAFSELEKFIEKPVRTYSSGMQSKLGFAITAILKTDIILVDEVLSVGDLFFRKKSEARIQEMIHGGSTVLMVSHSPGVIRENCTQALWLDRGKLRLFGSPKAVCDAFEASQQPGKEHP